MPNIVACFTIDNNALHYPAATNCKKTIGAIMPWLRERTCQQKAPGQHRYSLQCTLVQHEALFTLHERICLMHTAVKHEGVVLKPDSKMRLWLDDTPAADMTHTHNTLSPRNCCSQLDSHAKLRVIHKLTS